MDKERVKVWFELEEDWHKQATETLWAIKVGSDSYQLENVPFYVKGVSFGDIVSVRVDDERLMFQSIISTSGHSTYRIILSPETNDEKFINYWKSLEEIGCTYEKVRDKFYAIDVPAATDIYAAYSLLESGEENEVWDFEEGNCGHQLNADT